MKGTGRGWVNSCRLNRPRTEVDEEEEVEKECVSFGLSSKVTGDLRGMLNLPPSFISR